MHGEGLPRGGRCGWKWEKVRVRPEGCKARSRLAIASQYEGEPSKGLAESGSLSNPHIGLSLTPPLSAHVWGEREEAPIQLASLPWMWISSGELGPSAWKSTRSQEGARRSSNTMRVRVEKRKEVGVKNKLHN